MTYRAPHYGPWDRELRAPRRRECRSHATFCHEHQPRISLPWQPCRTPEGLIPLLLCAAASLFLRSQPRRFSDVPGLKDQAALLEPPASTSTPIRSLSFMIMYSTPSSLTSVPDHLPNSTRSPTLTSIGMSLPLSSRPPGPTAMTAPSWGFSFAVSGMMMPPLVFSSASIRLTTTRS